MKTIPTEYEFSDAAKKAGGHLNLYPAEQHTDYIHGISVSLAITSETQKYIDDTIYEWLANDLPTVILTFGTTTGDDSADLMFVKSIVNFATCNNHVAQYAIAMTTHPSYRKIHSRYLGTIEYYEIQKDGIGFIQNYVTNMNFSQKLGARKHSSFLTITPSREPIEKVEVHD